MRNQDATYQRYARQTMLNGFGTEGQDKLLNAKVLVIGAGGLGCPALQYLTAAGTGTIGIVDFDTIELTNLQRQTLYSVDDIGKPKAATAAEKLKRLNPDVQFQIFSERLNPSNALDIIAPFDLVIDGTDNFPTRYMANDACVLLQKPYIYGAVLRFEGQAGVFNLCGDVPEPPANYRDLFPTPPDPATVPSCNEAGVLGVLPGIIGTLQATEALKIITGIGEPLRNKILCYNALTNLFYDFSISASEKKNDHFPDTKTAFKNFNYEWFCGNRNDDKEISIEDFDNLICEERLTVIDVREYNELPEAYEFHNLQIPLSAFDKSIGEIDDRNTVILFCQSGIRSLKALIMLKNKYPACRAYSLKGGIIAWKKQHARPVEKSSTTN